MKGSVIFDMDGTLADVTHRRHLVSGKHRDYEAFHALLSEDPLNEWCAEIMKQFYFAGFDVVIVSARPARYETQTRKWLESHGVLYTSLNLLRLNDDSTPAQELKRAWLHSYGKENILFVCDDRTKVCSMWREEGLTCLQCDVWAEK